MERLDEPQLFIETSSRRLNYPSPTGIFLRAWERALND